MAKATKVVEALEAAVEPHSPLDATDTEVVEAAGGEPCAECRYKHILAAAAILAAESINGHPESAAHVRAELDLARSHGWSGDATTPLELFNDMGISDVEARALGHLALAEEFLSTNYLDMAETVRAVRREIMRRDGALSKGCTGGQDAGQARRSALMGNLADLMRASNPDNLTKYDFGKLMSTLPCLSICDGNRSLESFCARVARSVSGG